MVHLPSHLHPTALRHKPSASRVAFIDKSVNCRNLATIDSVGEVKRARKRSLAYDG
jgi:hypothetical protein